MTAGRVYLVGAGPGDPGLLTLRGRECIESADVILCDDLVDRRVLRFARADAEVVAAGKHGEASERDRQQEAIHERMIREATAGKTVVRLKGGDPFVFGRGGEEAGRLREAGIPFEIVPGVSSATAVPAYAGIPVTHRGLNSSFTVVTGHEAPGAAGRLDWPALARMETLVFLMALKRLPEVARLLIDAGKDPGTPSACVRAGTRPDQETIVATLKTLARRVEDAGTQPPAVVVVGQVVALRERLAWFEKRPLLGRRILVTRAASQAEDFGQKLERLGAETIESATIEIRPPESFAAFDDALASLESYQWVVFTSPNGVDAFFARLSSRGEDVRRLGHARIAAIGPATAAALRGRGLGVEAMPEKYRAEDLAEVLAHRVRGQRVLLARAAGAREVLPRTLEEVGAQVADVPIYRAVRVARLAHAAREALVQNRVDAVTFTSSSTVANFCSLLRDEGLELGSAKVACIGPVTAATARSLGLSVDVEAREYTTDGLTQALIDYFTPGS